MRGLNPSGPPDEPAGNEKIAFLTISSDATSETAGSGDGRAEDSRDEGGCFSRNLFKTSADGVEKESLETSSLIAAFKFPSSSFEAIDLVRDGITLEGLEFTGRWSRGEIVEIEAASEAAECEREAIRFIIKDGKLALFPDFSGTFRTKDVQ